MIACLTTAFNVFPILTVPHLVIAVLAFAFLYANTHRA